MAPPEPAGAGPGGPPRICVLTCGGTIAMVRRHGVLRPGGDPLDVLALAPEVARLAEIDVVPLFDKDSTNVTPEDWTRLADAVVERLGAPDPYRGFVVLHGTDTLPYTASALAFALGPGLNVPVVCTGSQADPTVVHGDARPNLVRAVRVALEPIAEVVIAFGDTVVRGCRAQKRDARHWHAFDSPACPPLAEITPTAVSVRPEARRVVADPGPLEYRPHFDAEVLQIAVDPGVRPSRLLGLLDAGWEGVVLRALGAGNVPDEGAYSFVPFITEAVGRGIPVALVSPFPAGSTEGSDYGPGVAAVRAGAMTTANMTNAAAVVKFRWVLARARRAVAAGELAEADRPAWVADRLARPYVGELDRG